MLTVVSIRSSITFAAGQSSEIGRYEVPGEESLSGLGIGMTIDDFQIAGIRHDVTESLKSAVRYSIALGLMTWSVVNVTADINDFRFISLDTIRVSREEVCLPSFDVVNCLLK